MRAVEELHLFEGYGVELEYMIVDRNRLSVLPLADLVLQAQSGALVNEVEVGPLCFSNELVLHVIELKTNGPAKALGRQADYFQKGVERINQHLSAHGATLMPGGMHPWMDPLHETRLWPHGDSSIYAAYDRIFGCQGHGWSNVQSTHLNLPFQGDKEFGRLHAAIRLILPLLPGLAASSPLVEGHSNGVLNNRLCAYQQNQRKIPVITGSLVPEAVFTRQAYHQEILQPIYQAIAPYDPGVILQHEWLNSRGAIARFERNAIEIRLLDVQECPRADLAIIELICAVLKALVDERWCSLEEQQHWSESTLAKWLNATISDGERVRIANAEYLSLFGFSGKRASVGELWYHLACALRHNMIAKPGLPLEVILNKGPLARRILNAAGRSSSRMKLDEIYSCLCDCLARGEMFHG
ncbi:MAG: glutamate-cysteine ligase family protein [Desulfuromonadales bacterium]|nr:glutamate-cysteine ligase family protein [Desulfuromonadales bacterium]